MELSSTDLTPAATHCADEQLSLLLSCSSQSGSVCKLRTLHDSVNYFGIKNALHGTSAESACLPECTGEQ